MNELKEIKEDIKDIKDNHLLHIYETLSNHKAKLNILLTLSVGIILLLLGVLLR